MIKSFKNLSSNINQLIKENRRAKSQTDRIKAIRKHPGLLKDLADATNRINLKTKPSNYDRYRYSKLIESLTNWITNGTGDHDKKYNKKPKETPSDINDTIDVSSRLYVGNHNHYVQGALKPTKVELKDQNIKDLYDGIHELRHQTGNRYQITRAIHEMKEDLNMAIINRRGIDEFNQTNNTVTPMTQDNLPLNNYNYAKYVITHHKDELPTNENIRLDKMAADQKIGAKDPILKDLEVGYTETETANRNHISQSKVSYVLNKAIQKVTATE